MSIVGVLLAAGNSSRFGSHKLMTPLSDGRPIGIHSANNMAGAVDHCIAIVRDQDKVLIDQLRQLGFEIVIQPVLDAGMGNSLALGIKASMHAEGWLIVLADMPWINPSTFQQVVDSLRKGACIAAPFYQNKRGHPVGLSHIYREELLLLEGDVGARQLLKEHSDDIEAIAVEDPAILRDVDTLQDLFLDDRL